METLHVWERKDIVLHAANSYKNPYMEVDVWAELEGPGFKKKVYGFWDGEDTFIIRLTATAPGEWCYRTGANVDDPGLIGKTGHFTAIEWTPQEKFENPCRRGMVVATPNGHGFQYADGTPVYILADTCWSAMTHRYPWYDDDEKREVGSGIGFKDVIRIRKQQGFNAIAVLSCFPAWENDGLPCIMQLDDPDRTTLRAAWGKPGTVSRDGGLSVKEMHNEGGKPFCFPGKIPDYEDLYPDVERINPKYFQVMDRKVDYLNSQGFVLFVETIRRDISQAWKKFYSWPGSFTRFIHYLFCRYQANNCLYSPIHFDTWKHSIPGRDYNLPTNLYIEQYGPPPFGTLLGSNPDISTLVDFGDADEAKWLTFHQIGNTSREHDFYWYLTQIYHAEPTRPALNGEPYYPGDQNGNGKDNIRVPPDTPEADFRCRSGLYGNLLSGGYAGYFYGAEGMWGGDIEPESRYRIWDALKYTSGEQIRHVLTFLGILDEPWSRLIPNAELVTPNKMGEPLGYRGWAFCSHTPNFDQVLLYFEKDCPSATVRGLPYGATYRLQWFDPCEGIWFDDPHNTLVETDRRCRIKLPERPDNQDYGMCLTIQ